ncbi:MAG: hypothetical protein Q4F27_06945 [Desulfovibrionaceae bacterium]|nr:hypothetical protein [Desulfovibrionaceae bacterium]
MAFLFLLAALVSWPRFFSFVFCAIYIAGGLIYSFVLLPRRDRQLLRNFSPSDE